MRIISIIFDVVIEQQIHVGNFVNNNLLREIFALGAFFSSFSCLNSSQLLSKEEGLLP